MIVPTRPRGLAAPILLAVATFATPASADMRQEMEAMFDSMVNATPPGVYQSARRGEITGGNLYVRNRIVTPNLVSITPPSVRAGCGGIDLYTGSFSFINADQFVQLSRAVASNAVGYSFNLALDAMCPQCLSTIETLAAKVQELNQYLGNSCQLAQGIVNDTASAMTGKKVGDASLISTFEGLGDTFESMTTADGETPTESAFAGAPERAEEELQGNVVWRALKESNVGEWFDSGHGDDQVLSVIMSLTGTVIVQYDADADSFDVTTIPGDPSILESFITGAPVSYLDCRGQDENGCLGPDPAAGDWTDEGFARAIFTKFTEPGGLIEEMRAGTQPVPELQDLLGASPGTAGNLLRLSAISEAAAHTFAREAAYQLAVELTAHLVNDLRQSVAHSMSRVRDDSHVEDAMTVVNHSWAQNQAELSRLQRKHGKIADLLAMYDGFFSVMQPPAEFALSRVNAASD